MSVSVPRGCQEVQVVMPATGSACKDKGGAVVCLEFLGPEGSSQHPSPGRISQLYVTDVAATQTFADCPDSTKLLVGVHLFRLWSGRHRRIAQVIHGAAHPMCLHVVLEIHTGRLSHLQRRRLRRYQLHPSARAPQPATVVQCVAGRPTPPSSQPRSIGIQCEATAAAVGADQSAITS